MVSMQQMVAEMIVKVESKKFKISSKIAKKLVYTQQKFIYYYIKKIKN